MSREVPALHVLFELFALRMYCCRTYKIETSLETQPYPHSGLLDKSDEKSSLSCGPSAAPSCFLAPWYPPPVWAPVDAHLLYELRLYGLLPKTGPGLDLTLT